jgi:hypothetical protein
VTAADVAAILAGLPAVAILTRRARRARFARITREQEHSYTVAAWQRFDEQQHRRYYKHARRIERRTRRIDAARVYYANQRLRAARRAEAPSRAERREAIREMVRQYDERNPRH